MIGPIVSLLPIPAVIAAGFITQVHLYTDELWVTVWVEDTEVSRVTVVHAVLVVTARF